MTELRGRGESVQQQVQLRALSQTLDALQNMSSMDTGSNTEFVQEGKRRVGEMLFQDNAVPSRVRELDLGNGLTISRDIPPDIQGETWNLTKVDQHAAQLALTLGQEWKPKFPSPPDQK